MTERIRQLSGAECAQIVDWAAAEGWNPGLGDAAAFHSADPAGFWGLFDGKELVACLSAVRYGPEFAFVGFYICRPEWRGRGLGYRLWREVIEGLVARSVGLDGVVDQQANYRRSGFELAHRNIRFGGSPVVAMPSDRGLRRLDPRDAKRIAAYEQANRFFPAERAPFLEAWFAMPEAISLALEPASGLSGYGTIRPCRDGWKIGPIFADGFDEAMTLACALIASAHGGPIYLDPPEPNRAALRLVAKLGLQPVFETARMYRGPAPALALDNIFGITSFELG